MGCTNFKSNGTGCDKSISKAFYYDQMGYAPDDIPDITNNIVDEVKTTNNNNKPLDEREKKPVINRELDDDYIEIKKAEVKPVLYGEANLNDVVFTVVKTLQNVSRKRYFNEKTLVDVLVGTESEQVYKNNLSKVPEFRALSELPYDTVQAVVEWMITQHLILKTKERYPVLHSTYDGLHYSEFITEGKLKKLKKYLEEDVILWM